MKTQRERIIYKLERDGFITRNECLKVYITRLSAVICDLKKEGWEFTTGTNNGDYVYTVNKKPLKIIRKAEIVIGVDGKHKAILRDIIV